MTHTLPATPTTVHLGGFGPEVPAAVSVASGDRVNVQTFSGFYVRAQGPALFRIAGVDATCDALHEDRKLGPGPHLLTGPIRVAGAMPGDVLEIVFEQIELTTDAGFNAIRAGWGVLQDEFPTTKLRWISLDREAMTARPVDGSDVRVPLRPFFGFVGVATPGPARSSIPPGTFGGNIDLRDLTVGTKLLQPVFVPGAMLSVGDGHAAQGDGEINVTAIETHLDGRLRLTVRRDIKLSSPVAITESSVIPLGFGETLDDALADATRRAIDLLHRFGGVSREDAYVLCSLAVSFRVTQAVNVPARGVHAMIPKSLFKNGGPLA
jgi:acetamidase/formamidase